MLRGFTDSTGVEWRVWEVFPAPNTESTSTEALSRTSLKDTAFANGWLCFESPAEKRRLAPIPPGWEFREPPSLEKLRDQATIVPIKMRSGKVAGAPSPQR